MKRILPWVGLGLFAAAMGGAQFGCGGSDGGGGGGTGKGGAGGAGGAILGGAGGLGGSGIGGTGTGGTGTGGGGGSGGTQQKRLGRACATDAECGQGLVCEKANGGNFDGEGPGKGYCTVDCSADETICAGFDTTASCLSFENGKAFCFEGCTFGPDNLQAFDPKKCHGRPESACSPLFDSTGNFTKPACIPQCNSDTDCGTGLKCNPRTGFCGTTPPTGKSLGSVCVQDLEGGTNECKGTCIGLVHNSGTDPFTYMCAEGCTFGAQPACGWNGTPPAPASCLFTSTVILDNGGAGIGDQGSCGVLCDCNSQCPNPALVCQAWTGPNAGTAESFYGKKGYCSDPLQDDGGTSAGIPTCGGGTGGSGTGGAPADAGTD